LKEKVTTKYCHKCGSTALVLLISMNKKMCADCKHKMDWYLEPGQEPIFEGTVSK